MNELSTVGDYIRWGASRLAAAGASFGHGTDNAADEARVLVFHALSLDFVVPEYFYRCRLTASEIERVEALLGARITERIPAAYLTGEALFAGLVFVCDERALVPRSPLAEMILQGFDPWVSASGPRRILDLCTGGGSIAIACGHYFPEAEIDAVDLSGSALALAVENAERHGVEDRVKFHEGDLFAPLGDARYDLIVSNPPYVSRAEYDALPPEYHAEPALGLEAGADGLDVVARILAGAADHLTPDGVLIVEVGASAPAVRKRFAGLPFSWPAFENGGEGVFVLDADGLEKFAAAAGA